MKKYSFSYKLLNRDELSAAHQNLLSIADQATAASYAPYSNFNVGAAILKKDGSILLGSNKENAAYPAGLCAERTALGQLNFKTDIVQAIAISYHSGDKHLTQPLSPCGICRQSIMEVEDSQNSPITIIMGGPGKKVIIIDDAKNLLPFAFGKNDLPED